MYDFYNSWKTVRQVRALRKF